MSSPSVTIHLAPDMFELLRQQANKAQRSLEAEIEARVRQSLQEATAEAQTEAHLTAMTAFEDAKLWHILHEQANEEAEARLQALLEKQGWLGDLPQHEQEELHLLNQYFNQLMLSRAHALELLAERGHDMSDYLAQLQASK